MRKRNDIIKDLKTLILKKGYIYSFCEVLLNDFCFDPEKLSDLNINEKVSINEAALILGFLVQNNISLEAPESHDSLLKMKFETYELLEELHRSFMDLFGGFLRKEMEEEKDKEKKTYKREKSIWLNQDMMIEPIFYSDSGIYDFQYLDYIELKYKYDVGWLLENKGFNIKEIKETTSNIRALLQNKIQLSYLTGVNIFVNEAIEKLTKEKKLKNQSLLSIKKEYEPLIYASIFEKTDYKTYCNDLLNLFTINKNEKEIINIEFLLKNFSVLPKQNLNNSFREIGDYNVVNSHPIIDLSEYGLFVPVTFLLYQAVYESPYYWMIKDTEYINIASSNRGSVGEEMFYNLLIKVFTKDCTFKSIKIKEKKSTISTDIDVLCVCDDKAVCVQVKSKKLTLLSKRGDAFQLQKDFKESIQEAYEQGLLCRKKILSKNSKFIGEDGNEIFLPNEINDCYIICGTTETFSALAFLAHEMLLKNESDPYPLSVSIFDLELITHYLSDPYDFLYYVKLRTELNDYYMASSEIDLLGFHLTNKLYKNPEITDCYIDSSFAQLIDRNYYPKKMGISVSDSNDAIKKRWSNSDFDLLCESIKKKRIIKKPSILFSLYDLSGDSRNQLIEQIKKTKNLTLYDHRNHDFSMGFDMNRGNGTGITYFSLNTDSLDELKQKVILFCTAKKYKLKSNFWIGLGSLLGSKEIIDFVFVDDSRWQFNENFEILSNKYFGERNPNLKKEKIRRNDPCYCGSGIKYKNCHGKTK